MKRVEFAELAGITPAMVTKYDDQGLIAFSSPKVVDARATLQLLAGRLDEDKRQAALEKLDALDRIAANDTSAPEAPPLAARTGAKNAKTEIDELKRDKLLVELAEKSGDLIPIATVERVILDAIAEMQAAFDQETHATAAQLTIDLGLSTERTAMLTRRMRTLANKARQRFAAKMLELSGEGAAPIEAGDAAEDEAPAAS
ncbi:MAG: hypothetical protein ACK4X1_11725 [Terricaulis sp.]